LIFSRLISASFPTFETELFLIMQLTQLSPRKALNKAYLKVKPTRSEIELFKQNLIGLLDGLDESESEEHNKNDLGDFIKNTFYHPKFYINTKDRTDLVIHNGIDAKRFAGVLIEVKKASNKTEMIQPDNLNAKAFHELILYYLRERITNHNLEIKHLVVTNIYEWYVFNAALFEKTFAQDKTLVKQFTNFEEGRLAGKSTDFFYNEIAEPFVAGLTSEFCFTYFDFRDYDKPLRNEDKKDDFKLIALYKLLSPEHLLKLPFANDSNSLDKTFYTELLHIIGLTETKEGSKKLIGRKKEGERNYGSFIENAIIQLDSLDKISRLDKPSQFGETIQERLFNVALELSITWINRILFLKLLEAQLIRYHKSDPAYAFLNCEKIQNFDDLNTLFFSVLARKHDDRNEEVRKIFSNIPYLNSSLFEPTGIEHSCLFISQLKDGKLPILSSTVLKDNNGKKCKGELFTLEYLFKFLDAYDFAGEGSEEIQEENKTLINASVLGLIFEKINGYKDGSFFTPGFITMYMCRETIRRAIVQKFNEQKGWNCEDLTGLYDKIEDKKEANEIINQLKICDPAVGSGHFLVSALNEIISIKSELKILIDKEGKRLKEYHVEVVNDELIITDEDGKLFEYNPNSPESHRVQETIFHEKQTIIENCLFGVDINPNSVKICRLRLWIELLKNAYYKSQGEKRTSSPVHQFTTSQVERELETLPNIDINIKCGNSLISRYALDADIRQALKKSKWNIESYRLAVMTYRNAENKEQKRVMAALIEKIKNDFQIEISMNDPKKRRLDKLLGELYHRFTGNFLFEPGTDYGNNQNKDKGKEEQTKLENEINKITKELEEVKNNKIYENSFEWRFEFPEVLNEEGDFIGFDVVIGNPPYGATLSEESKIFYKIAYSSFHTRWTDTFNYFILRSFQLSNKTGIISLIIPNNLFYQNEYEKSRERILKDHQILHAINLGDHVFYDADVPTAIMIAINKPKEEYQYLYSDHRKTIKDNNLFINSVPIAIDKRASKESTSFLIGINKSFSKIFSKVTTESDLIDIISDEVANGIQPTGDKIFRLNLDDVIKNKIEPQILRKVLVGGDFNKYSFPKSESWVIYTTKSIEESSIPNTIKYLEQFKEILSRKRETIKGILPWWCLHWPRYPKLFEESKIILRQTSDRIIATYDDQDFYAMNNVIIVKLKNELVFDYKYILGILNSTLLHYIYCQITQESDRTFAEVKPINIRKLPIKRVEENEQMQIISIVNQILTSKESNPSADTSALEKEIDRLVYELYGLTEEEIRIIENG
jgi:hypothetical protein